MEAFKGKVVRLRVWGSVPSAPRTRLPLTIDAIYQGEKGRQNSNSNDILRSFPFYFFEWMAKNGEGKWPTHTLCWCVCVFFQWFSTNAKSNFKWRKNITTCVYGCSSSQLHIFTRLFGQEKSGLPPQKSLGFGVKKLSKHLLKLREEEEGQEKLLPKTLQIWGAPKWVSMTFSDH